jgi:hypothetical protein
MSELNKIIILVGPAEESVIKDPKGNSKDPKDPKDSKIQEDPKDPKDQEEIFIEYPIYRLCNFSKLFFSILTTESKEKTENKISLKHSCTFDEFYAMNVLMSNAYNLMNVVDYFIDCVDLLIYIENDSIAKIVIEIIFMEYLDRINPLKIPRKYLKDTTIIRGVIGIYKVFYKEENVLNDIFNDDFIKFYFDLLYKENSIDFLDSMSETLKSRLLKFIIMNP